jgi:guanylate kinase
MEFAAGKFDHVLVNDNLQAAFAEAESIIEDFLRK